MRLSVEQVGQFIKDAKLLQTHVMETCRRPDGQLMVPLDNYYGTVIDAAVRVALVADEFSRLEVQLGIPSTPVEISP